MSRKDTPSSLRILLANALPAQAHTSVIVGADFMPLVWIDGQRSPDAVALHTRLTTLGKCLGQFSESELERVYGKIDVRWIYAYGNTSAFFLHVLIDAPSFSSPVAVPTLRTEFAVRFTLSEATAHLLRIIAECRRMLLHFDAEPEWMQHLPSLQGHDQAKDMGERGLAVVRSSLYISFRPDLIARMAGQLDTWERARGYKLR